MLSHCPHIRVMLGRAEGVILLGGSSLPLLERWCWLGALVMPTFGGIKGVSVKVPLSKSFRFPFNSPQLVPVDWGVVSGGHPCQTNSATSAADVREV